MNTAKIIAAFSLALFSAGVAAQSAGAVQQAPQSTVTIAQAATGASDNQDDTRGAADTGFGSGDTKLPTAAIVGGVVVVGAIIAIAASSGGSSGGGSSSTPSHQ